MMILRPDVTYATGVRQPIGTFQPTADVMANVAQFTLGPQGFQQGGLNGIIHGGLVGGKVWKSLHLMGGPSWWQNLKMRFAAWKTRRQLRGLGFTPYGPQSWAGGRAVPYADNRRSMLIAMNERHLPSQFQPSVQASLVAGRY